MLPVISLLVALTFALVITRVATVALTLTGLPKQSARFQARSAFTGTGFTTGEAESVLGHPVRRRIIMLLMLLGNLGLVTVVTSLILSFANLTNGEHRYLTLVVLIVGLVFFWYAATSQALDRWMCRLIAWVLRKWTDMEVRDYAQLLQLAKGYGVAEAKVDANDWMANRTLSELALDTRGVLVLGIRHDDGAYEGAPRGDTRISVEDVIIVYGRDDAVGSVCGRKTA